MKYAMIILGGAAWDRPAGGSDGATPLEFAAAPTLAEIARTGRVGAVAAAPRDGAPTAEACAASLLGHDPACALAPAALEAVALGVEASPHDAFLSLAFLSTDDETGAVLGPAPALTHAEAALLLGDLMTAWRAAEPELARSLSAAQRSDAPACVLIDRSGRSYEGVRTASPEAVASSGAPWRRFAPSGAGELGGALARLVDAGVDVLAEHDINRARRDSGVRPASLAWIWGPGRRPALPDVADQTGLRAAVVARRDAVAGLARCAGWDRVPLPVPPTHDAGADDLAALGAAAAGALDRYDLVCVHVDADASSADAGARSLERIDAAVVAPVLSRLRIEPTQSPDDDAGWRILVACDRALPAPGKATRSLPTPFAMAGAWVRSVIDRPFTEAAAAESDLIVDPGSDLLEYFLFGGMKHLRPQRAPRPRRRPAPTEEAHGDRSR